MLAKFHLAEDAFALHLPLQRLERIRPERRVQPDVRVRDRPRACLLYALQF